MKKMILLVLSLIFLTGCGIFDLNGWVTPDDKDFLACIQELNTPEKIGQYMQDNFIYEIHDFYAPDPYTLWQTKLGDCNDFSAFGIFIADYHDYETYQIEIFDDTIFQHYVAVYNENIWYSITDCQNYYFGFSTFEEIADYVCDIRLKVWTKYIVYDYWNNIVEEIYNN